MACENTFPKGSKDRKTGKTTQQRGLSTHLAVAQRLVEIGYEVLQPLDPSLPYDLAFVSMAKNEGCRSELPVLMRVQCKTARLSPDEAYIAFNGYINGGRVEENRRVRKGYWGEAEWFGVYCAEIGKVYLVPVQAFTNGAEIRLRLKKTKNNQETRVTWAKDYEI